jgi:hypothetical protein
MPEVNQFYFKYPEVIEALIKKAGLHEGKWQLIVNFGLGPVNMGPTPDQIVPGAALAVIAIGLQKATPESPEALTADAAVINPASASSQKRRPLKRSRGASRGSS